MPKPGLNTNTATPPPPVVSDATIWQASLIDVIPNAVLGGGAILRVYVQDRPGEPIEIRLGETIITGTAGSKPEYGPFAAEFAPLPPGQWLVSAPALGTNLAIQTDDRSLFIVEFKLVSAAQATAAAQVTATPTPLGNTVWEGKWVKTIEGPSVAGALLRIKVEGRSGHPVDIATFTDFIGQGMTGSKPELPNDEVEFAGLAPGRYFITPHGLNTQFVVELEVNTSTFIEFHPIQAPPPQAPPPAGATPVVIFTPTPLPQVSAPQAQPTTSPTPPPTPATNKRWLVVVEQRQPINQAAPELIIRGDNLEQAVITLLGGNPFREMSCTTTKQRDDDYRCQIEGLLPGLYTVSWADEGLSIPLRLENKERVVVAFKQETPPIEATIWQVQLTQNSNQALPTALTQGVIIIQLANRNGQVISLIDSRGRRRLCETDKNGLCRFNQLGAGVYVIEPANIPVRYALYVDGQGRARVNFEELPRSTQIISSSSESIVGHGAKPKTAQTGGGAVKREPTATAALSPTPTVPPPPATATRTPIPVLPAATIIATLTPSPLPTLSPTPALAWFGSVIENYTHPGQTIIARAPLGDYPVILQSGPWQLESHTGSKPELGEGAVEFAGLAPGDYTVVLVGLAEIQISLTPDHFIVVQFSYGPAPTPTPTPQPGQWVAAIIENSSSTEPGGAWSILTVEVGNITGLPIRISTDGFETECLTGTKPELGSGVCQIGGLWPATYRVQPAGLPVSMNVTLDGRGAAWVAFWQQ